MTTFRNKQKDGRDTVSSGARSHREGTKWSDELTTDSTASYAIVTDISMAEPPAAGRSLARSLERQSTVTATLLVSTISLSARSDSSSMLPLAACRSRRRRCRRFSEVNSSESYFSWTKPARYPPSIRTRAASPILTTAMAASVTTTRITMSVGRPWRTIRTSM